MKNKLLCISTALVLCISVQGCAVLSYYGLKQMDLSRPYKETWIDKLSDKTNDPNYKESEIRKINERQGRVR